MAGPDRQVELPVGRECGQLGQCLPKAVGGAAAAEPHTVLGGGHFFSLTGRPTSRAARPHTKRNAAAVAAPREAPAIVWAGVWYFSATRDQHTAAVRA